MTKGADASRRYRDKRRGRPARQPEPCPSRAAAIRHRRRGEEVCDDCKQAERGYMNGLRNAD